MWMLGPLAATAVLALGSHSTSTQPGGYALVQLTPAAVCTDTVPLLAAGATQVAPALRVFRLAAATAYRLAPGLRARRALQTVELDRPLRAAGVTAVTAEEPDPLEPSEWWRAAIGIDGLEPPGPGKPVTIVDSGLDLQHPEFADRPDTIALNTQEPAPLGGQHGTAVASLIGAPRNGVGIVGVYPQAVLRSWDTALGEGTAIDTSEVVKGITAAAAAGPGVINLSLGSPQKDDLVAQAINLAFAKGSLVVVASGNDGENGNPAEYPADYPHVLTVGATDKSDGVASFSSRSAFVDLVAPGEDVTVATAAESSWTSGSGTSFSTPIVAGAAAWIWTVRPQLDNTQLFEVMRRSAKDVGLPGRDDASGYGMLDVGAALAYPAPVRDPLEPNDDIAASEAGGTLAAAPAALTTPRRPRASLRARLDRVEDPRDVYRIWLPRNARVHVAATSAANVVLRVWGPRTTSVDAIEDADLLGKDARLRAGRKQVMVAPAGAGRWAYVEVTLGGRRGLEATYSLSVAA